MKQLEEQGSITQTVTAPEGIQSRRFLDLVWPHRPLRFFVRIKGSDHQAEELRVTDAEMAIKETAEARARGDTVEFSLTEISRLMHGSSLAKTRLYALALKLFYQDDASQPLTHHLAQLDECLQMAEIPPMTHVVCSPGRLDLYWSTRESLTPEQWSPYVDRLLAIVKATGVNVERPVVEEFWPFPQPDVSSSQNSAQQPRLVREGSPAEWTALTNSINAAYKKLSHTPRLGAGQLSASADATVAAAAVVSIPNLVPVSGPPQEAAVNPFSRYSLRGYEEELAKRMVPQTPFVGRFSSMGSSTVIYADPGTGKTLITLAAIIKAIEDGHIDPAQLYYLNTDDSSEGLYQKATLLAPYKVNMVGQGLKGFDTADFLSLLTETINNGTAKNSMLVLDTIKQVADIMDKKRISTFTRWTRRYVQSGGTLLALAHTTKRKTDAGKSIYAGTTDIREDFDTAYMMSVNEAESDDSRMVVDLEALKIRGNLPPRTAYQYEVDRSSYENMLLSVSEVDEATQQTMQKRAQELGDGPVIEAIRRCITEGVVSKVALASAAGKLVKLGKHTVTKIIDKYAGDDPASHKWTFTRGNRGVMEFRLLGSAPA